MMYEKNKNISMVTGKSAGHCRIASSRPAGHGKAATNAGAIFYE